MEWFSRISLLRVCHQWLWSHVLPDQCSPTPQVQRKRYHGIQLVEHVQQPNSWQTTPQTWQVQLLEEHFLSLPNWHLCSLDPLHFFKLLQHSWWDPYLWYGIHSFDLSDPNSFSNDDQSSNQIPHHAATCLLPVAISVWVFTMLSLWGKQEPPPSSRACVIMCRLLTRNMV